MCCHTQCHWGLLTEEEQSHFFHLLCHFNKTYCANHEKTDIQQTNDFKILSCIVSSMSQGQHQYGNQYRLYTSLRSEVDSILKVIKPQVYNKSAILRVKKPKCVNQPDGVKRRKTNPNPNPNQQPKSNTKPTKPNTQQCDDVQASKQLSVIDSNGQGVKVEYSTYMFVAQVIMVFLVFLCGIIHLFLPDSIRNQQFDGMWLSLVSACAGVLLPSPQFVKTFKTA